jgi:DNA-binding beta-propeller fold protein YncE
MTTRNDEKRSLRVLRHHLPRTTRANRSARWLVLVLCLACVLIPAGNSQTVLSHPGLMYIGTLDHKLLVFDEDKEEVVGEIPVTGVPRITALSADQKQLYVINTRMGIEIVDLATRTVTSKFTLEDGRSRPDMISFTPSRLSPGNLDYDMFSGLAVDPAGRYLYTTLRVVVKEIDQYRLDPTRFVAIDLKDQKIARTFDFPKDLNRGFGFLSSFKVSPDGKLLYVFDNDIRIFDLATFTQVDSIPLSKPPYPGAAPYRLTVTDDPYDDTTKVTSVFTSVDPIVHKGTLGLATLDLLTRKLNYKVIGPSLPMLGFLVSPDRKLGYSAMFTSTHGNRRTEWWIWDIATQQVIKKQEFESRPTFRFGISSDGKKLYLYGSGSTLEVIDAKTLQSIKVIYLNKDITTNLVTLARK